MTQLSQSTPTSASLLDIVARASLFEILQQAMKRQPRPEPLPHRLHADLGLPPVDAQGHDTLS